MDFLLNDYKGQSSNMFWPFLWWRLGVALSGAQSR